MTIEMCSRRILDTKANLASLDQADKERIEKVNIYLLKLRC